MKLILQQALRGLSSKKGLTLLLLLMLTAGLFLTLGSISYRHGSEQQLGDFYAAYPDDEYRFHLKSPFLFEAGGNPAAYSLGDLTEYLQAIRSAEEFTFYHFSTLQLRLFALSVPDCCLSGYEMYAAARNLSYPERHQETYAGYGALSGAAAYSVDPQVLQKFRLQVSNGSDFSDFNAADWDTDVVPMVCGSTWESYYTVGDRLYGPDLFDDNRVIAYEIIGFLRPGCAIILPDSENPEAIQALDNRLFIPTLDYSQAPTPTANRMNDQTLSYAERTEYARMCAACLDLCEGIIICDNPLPPTEKYAQQYGFLTQNRERAMLIGEDFRRGADRYFGLLDLCAGLILIGSGFCLTVNLTNKLLDRFREYAIHQLCGATLGQVRLFLISETALLLAASEAAALLCALAFGNGVFTYRVGGAIGVQITALDPIAILWTLTLGAGIGTSALAVPMIRLSTAEFDTLLRGRE